jgi:tetratricopeptide (TPR) repeat protein
MGKYFKKEKKIIPSSISKFYSLGIYYFKNEEYKKAIEFFKKVLMIDPDYLDSKNKMRLLIKKLKSKENYLSEKYYSIIDGYLIDKKISVIGGNINFKTWFNLGVCYKETQMYEQSVAAFKNALRIKPNHTDTHFELSSIYDEIENYYEYTTKIRNEEELLDIDDQINDENDKEKYLEETMPQELNLSELHYRLGWAFSEPEPKYYLHAFELCERVINIEPEFADVYYWLGWIYEKLKQYKGAAFAYNKAIYIDENYVFAYNRLGNIYLKQLKFGEAIELYKESIKNNPENIQAYLRIGSIYNKILQYDKAMEILKKALKIDPQNFFLWSLISKSYGNLGWYNNEKDALKKVIDIKPDYFKAYKLFSNIISNEEAFAIWLKKQGTSESATRIAINDITEISNYALKKNKSKIAIFDLLTANQFNKMYNLLFSDKVFKNKNKERHNAYFLAMNKYSKFLKQSKSDVSTNISAKETDIISNKRPEENITVAVTQNLEQPFTIVKESDNNHGGSCIPGRKLRTVDEYITNAEIDTSHEQLLISTVLNNSFKNGIKLGSIINIRKFMMAFHDTYPDYDLSDDANILKEKIRRVTIQCPNDLYMTPNTITKDITLIKEILSYIIDTLKSGRMVIYIENIFNKFKNQLLDTNIYNKDILENLIKHYLKDDVNYSQGAILSEYGAKLNIDDEVLEVLSGSDIPLNRQEIFDVLPHLTHSKIEHILKSDKRSIYIQRNIYWHIDKFEVTEEDKFLLDDIIRCEIKDGFISLKKLLDVLNTQASDFIQKNNIVNHVCLRDVLKYYFGDDFGFQYTFIGRKNEEMSGVVATRNFLADKEKFKLSELFDFIDENDLPNHYELFIEEANKEFIRINEQEFIRRINFAISDLDIKNIEEVIQKYLTNGYVAINKIDSFAIFPSIVFQWNSFLLESIIENYCYGYEVIDCSRSITKSIGVIVSKMAGFKNFNEILIDVIAEHDKYHPFQSSKDALEYLYDNAYIAQKRYNNFEVIFSLAKQKTI